MEYPDVNMCDSSNEELDATTELATQIEALARTSNLLLHRLDSIERAIEQETFELASLKVRIKDGPNAADVRSLVTTLNLAEPILIGDFLKALNQHIITHNLVDLNDLEITVTPYIRKAFYLQPTDTKIPYAKLLLGLPSMFM
jgi:hypothetical protein